MSNDEKRPEGDAKLMQLLAATHSLHASHEVASELERSKCSCEQTIDNLPIIFGILSDNGTIFRANKKLAKSFDLDMESCVGHQVFELFTDDGSKKFSSAIDELESHTNRNLSVDVDLDIDHPRKKIESLVWNIRPYGDLKGSDFKYLYQVIAQKRVDS